MVAIGEQEKHAKVSGKSKRPAPLTIPKENIQRAVSEKWIDRPAASTQKGHKHYKLGPNWRRNGLKLERSALVTLKS